MLNIQVINGKNMVPMGELSTWSKNDIVRNANFSDFTRLKKQISELGQYKNLLVLDDGTIIGGNHRYKAMVELAAEGDARFEKIWVSVLSFEEVPNGEGASFFRAVIDGEVQNKAAADIEQIKAEYMLSDNDEIAHWERDGLAQLMQPYKETLPADTYKIGLGYGTDVSTFLAEYNPGSIDYPQESEEEKKADEMKTVIARYSPDQYQQIEPMIEDFKSEFDLKNNTDMLTKLLEWWTHSKNVVSAIDSNEVRPVDTIPTTPVEPTAIENETPPAETIQGNENPDDTNPV